MDAPTFSLPLEISQSLHLDHYHNWFEDMKRLFKLCAPIEGSGDESRYSDHCAAFRLLWGLRGNLGDPDG